MDNILVNSAERKNDIRESAEKGYSREKTLKNNNIIKYFIITAINTIAVLPPGVSKSIG